jgi:hydroxymethylpyrimidine/phosphomethylpyrimidine kinase
MPSPSAADPASDSESSSPACVMSFNASDPSGAGGLAADTLAMASAGAHTLPVVTGAYMRDSAEIFDHAAFDEDAVAEQARTALEDMPVVAIKVGFVGSPENVSAIAEIASDYAEVPVIAYMPNLSWWDEASLDNYLDAFRDLMLPQTTVLVGNHSTLRRWLLPDWSGERSPSARDIAKAAAEHGVPYTLVTGIALPEQHIDNVLASPQTVLMSEKFEHFEASFAGAGDTLSAALTALLANGNDLQSATAEALSYLDHCLDAGFQPGMGQMLPDRLFWAQADVGEEDAESASAEPGLVSDDRISPAPPVFELPPHGTKQ